MIVVVLACSVQSYAQKGMQGVGVNFATNVVDAFAPGGGVKYQYNISNYVRLEPSFSLYGLAEDDGFSMAGMLNVHLFFSSPRSLRPYFFAGAGYVNFAFYSNDYWGDYKEDKGGVGADAGLGLDWRLSHKISLQLEAGVLAGSEDAQIGGKFNLGVCYNF